MEIYAGLPQRSAQIVILALMMGNVRAPEQGDLVSEAMLPVIGEIVEYETANPDP